MKYQLIRILAQINYIHFDSMEAYQIWSHGYFTSTVTLGILPVNSKR